MSTELLEVEKMAEKVKSFNRLNKPCACCSAAPNHEHSPDCTGGNHSLEVQEDYAVSAAREWVSKQAPVHMACAIQAVESVVQELAAIIRKHVDEYKYQHSWDCHDRECCPNR